MASTSLQKEFSVWDNCPADLLMLIFKYFDFKSLSACLQVNRCWRDVCVYYCDHFQLWDSLVKHCLFNNGQIYEQKSKHNNKELFLNAILWQDVSKAKTEIKDFYTSNTIKHIHVCKDTLIVVCESCVKILDVNTFAILKTLDITCEDYQETSNLLSILYAPIPGIEHSYTLKVNKKGSCRCSESDYQHPIPKTSLYSLTEKGCYFFDESYTLWVYKPKCGRHLRLLGRYYGHREPIHSISIHTTGLYIFLLNGNVLHVDKSQKIMCLLFRLDVPGWIFSLTPLAFDRFNVVYGIMDIPSSRVWVTKPQNTKALVLPDLTTAILHGDILLVGSKKGVLGVYYPSGLTTGSGVIPLLELNITLNDTPTAIRELEMYEGDGVHIIFVLIDERIVKVELSYPQFNNPG